MKPRVTLITLGVDDLDRAVKFYAEGMGLKTEGIVGREFAFGAVAFFELQGGLKLALWPRASLAHDTGLPPGAPNAIDISLAHNVASRAEVDAVMAEAAAAGTASSSLPSIPSGADTQATSWIRTSISGKWPGIPSGSWMRDACPVSLPAQPRFP